MFAKLAFKNIKRSVKDYAIYFFTLVLGVAIFYVFNSLESQSVMLNVTDRVRDMLRLMNVMLGVVSVFVSFILGALIIYASRFLIKRRSKEFGIYLTLGMGKRQISLILILETFLIGLLSLAVGLILGVIASQFTSILVANMFDADLTEFQFVFSASALVKTLIYFGIIYIFVMIFNTINISRQKLINLLSSSRRNEKIKNKNLWICTAVFVAASVALGYAYYFVTSGLEKLVMNADGPEVLLIPIIMGIVSTFLLFWSLSGILLRIFMSFKKVYYHKLNSFVLRQFSSKINTTVASMSVICLMLFVTICVLGTALSINHTLHENIEKSLPVDVQVEAIGRQAPSVREIYASEDIDIDELLDDVVTYKQYLVSSLSASSVKVVPADGEDEVEVSGFASAEEFVHLSDYNKVAKIFNLPTIELNDDEYAILANYEQIIKMRNQALASGAKITILGQTLSPRYDKCIEGTLQLEMANTNAGIVIVPDNVKLDDSETYQHEYLIGNYKNPENAEEIEQQIYSLDNRFFTIKPDDENYEEAETGKADNNFYYYNVETKQDIIDNNVGTSALVTFVGLYLGIIFLISSAAVLALKELSESSDNRSKYAVLRKIGASNRMLNCALFWQIFIFFIFPLAIAILHSVFGLMFCDFLLSSLGGVDIATTIPWVTLIILSIYGGYFLITYFCSRNIIKERRS